MYLSPKMDSSAKASGRLAGHTVSWWLPPLLSPETDDLLCACVQLGNPLDHKNERNVVAFSSAPVRALLLLSLTSKCQQERWPQLLSLGPPVSSLTPHDELWVILKQRRSTASSLNEVVGGP